MHILHGDYLLEYQIVLVRDNSSYLHTWAHIFYTHTHSSIMIMSAYTCGMLNNSTIVLLYILAIGVLIIFTNCHQFTPSPSFPLPFSSLSLHFAHAQVSQLVWSTICWRSTTWLFSTTRRSSALSLSFSSYCLPSSLSLATLYTRYRIIFFSVGIILEAPVIYSTFMKYMAVFHARLYTLIKCKAVCIRG